MTKGKDAQEEDIVIEDENSSPDLELKKLREKLKRCIREKEEYLAGWQRAKADFINARKDEKEQRIEFVKFAEEYLIRDLLAVADGFERIFSEKSWEKLDKAWQDGVRYLYNQFISILKEHNVELIKAEGKEFNPEEHESIGEVEVDEETKEDLVIEEVQKGYKIHNKVIRPVRVKVGKFKSQSMKHEA